MLYLIHGDDIDAARKDLDLKKQKAKGKELREVNGKWRCHILRFTV